MKSLKRAGNGRFGDRTSLLRRLLPPVGALLGAAAIVAMPAAAATTGHGGGKGGNGGNAPTFTRHTLPGTKPAWAAAATKTSPVSARQTLSAKVWLASRDAAGLAALAQAVGNPSSSQYRQYLSHDEYMSRFAPTSAQVSALKSWLKQAGLRVGSVGPDNHFVSVSGSASAIEAAFGAQLVDYTIDGNDRLAPGSDLSVPDGVIAVTGLTKFGHTVSKTDLGPPAGFRNSGPCSRYYGEKVATDLPKFEGSHIPYAVCGYVPSQLRSVYGVPAGSTGAGETVAITDAFDASTLLADANEYATRHGDPAFAAGQFSDRSFVEGDSTASPTPIEDCGGNGWYGEQTLDIEAVHGMATGANVDYYGAASCYDDDLLAALGKVVSDDDASLVTNSWGEPTFVRLSGHLYATIDQSLVDAYESIFQQGDVEGIGFYFSSGDTGDELASYGFKSPDFPTGDPFVTSVGGTSLAVGDDGERLFETGWGTSKYVPTPTGSSWTEAIHFQYGAGGGYSDVFARPSWQQALVTGNQGRAVPDVAMDADPTTGMLVGETQDFGGGDIGYGEYRLGCTSLASPLFAGLQAVAQATAGVHFGWANPMLYGLAQAEPGAFYDVTAEGDAGNVRVDFANGLDSSAGLLDSVRTFNADSTLNARTGWDDVTGIGAPSTNYLSLVH
jgi:subtilase family serine protease